MLRQDVGVLAPRLHPGGLHAELNMVRRSLCDGNPPEVKLTFKSIQRCLCVCRAPCKNANWPRERLVDKARFKEIKKKEE